MLKQDVVNFEVFTKHLTANEQHKLVKYLPSDPALPHERYMWFISKTSIIIVILF